VGMGLYATWGPSIKQRQYIFKEIAGIIAQNTLKMRKNRSQRIIDLKA